MYSHELIVIDEPFSEIAGEERINELEWLSDLRRRHNISLLVFTQDIDTAVMLGDYVMVVDKSTSSNHRDVEITARSARPGGRPSGGGCPRVPLHFPGIGRKARGEGAAERL